MTLASRTETQAVSTTGTGSLPDARRTSGPGPAWQARLWMVQRLSAMVLALCVVVHIAVIIVAVRNGLTADEILGRTQGSVAFGLFYAVFVLACAVHVPIGLLKIAEEWWRWRGTSVYLAASAFGLIVLVAGLRAVWAVTAVTHGSAP